MKKRRLFLSAVLCLTMLFSGLTVFAYTGNPDAIYCDLCEGDVVLNVYSYPVSNGQDTHTVRIEGVVDKNGDPIYAICTVTHTVTRVGKTCPTHGVRFDGTCYDEYHSYKDCPKYGLARHYE